MKVVKFVKALLNMFTWKPKSYFSCQLFLSILFFLNVNTFFLFVSKSSNKYYKVSYNLIHICCRQGRQIYYKSYFFILLYFIKKLMFADHVIHVEMKNGNRGCKTFKQNKNIVRALFITRWFKLIWENFYPIWITITKALTKYNQIGDWLPQRLYLSVKSFTKQCFRFFNFQDDKCKAFCCFFVETRKFFSIVD